MNSYKARVKMDAMRLNGFEIAALGNDNIVLSNIGIIQKKKEIPRFIFDRNQAIRAGRQTGKWVGVTLNEIEDAYFIRLSNIASGVLSTT